MRVVRAFPLLCMRYRDKVQSMNVAAPRPFGSWWSFKSRSEKKGQQLAYLYLSLAALDILVSVQATWRQSCEVSSIKIRDWHVRFSPFLEGVIPACGCPKDSPLNAYFASWLHDMESSACTMCWRFSVSGSMECVHPYLRWLIHPREFPALVHLRV